MSRKEASALFQEGIVNAKSLLSASSDRVATALRINVPFSPVDRTSRGGGAKGVVAAQIKSPLSTACLERAMCFWCQERVYGSGVVGNRTGHTRLTGLDRLGYPDPSISAAPRVFFVANLT